MHNFHQPWISYRLNINDEDSYIVSEVTYDSHHASPKYSVVAIATDDSYANAIAALPSLIELLHDIERSDDLTDIKGKASRLLVTLEFKNSKSEGTPF